MPPPKPEVLNEWVTLYEGCCLDVLPMLGPASVDVVITDPPFGERTHKGARTFVATGAQASFGFGELPTSLIDFSPLSDGEFSAVASSLVQAARRWVVMTCDLRHAVIAEQDGPDVFVRCGVWVKPDAAPQFSGDRPGTGWEAVLMLHRAGRKRWNGGGHQAVWTHHRDRSKAHPSVKPIPLIREWVRLFSDAGETVLDPFAGSGTTAVAAMLEGRKCVLVEKDPSYCDVIRRRVERASGDGPGSLFAATDAAASSLFREGL